MEEQNPCETCNGKDYCDGWEAQFCCTLCHYHYGDNAPCDVCDPMDI